MTRILLIGCGFLGKAAADLLLAARLRITVVVHSPESAQKLALSFFEQGIDPQEAEVLCADIGEPGALAEVVGARRAEFAAWLHCASSGGGGPEAYARVYAQGVKNLRQLFPGVQGVFVSSTSVYGQTDGSWVQETAPTEPNRETSRILLEAERETLAGGGSVLRLAGLYGPGRSVLLRKFLSGQARLEAGGERWINQIHRDDAARAAFLLLQPEVPVQGEIFNAADDSPLQQRALYAGMAQRLCKQLPPEGEPDYGRKRGWTNKRVNNAKLRGIGWLPKFPDYFADWSRLLSAESV